MAGLKLQSGRIGVAGATVFVVATLLFAARNKKPGPDSMDTASNSVIIANLQKGVECKLPDGSVRFRGNLGGTYTFRDGQTIGEFVPRARVSIKPVPNSGLTEVRFDDPAGKVPSAFTKVVDCEKPQ